MTSHSDSHGRRLFEQIQQEEDASRSLQSSDPEVQAHNLSVGRRLQHLRDRSQFGENMEQVIQLNGTECPWSFGHEPVGTSDNPEGRDDMMRKYWRNVDRKGFEECNERQANEGNPDFNKAHRTSTDDNPKYIMTRHPTQPYCVRCEMPKEVKTDFNEMVKGLEKIAAMMSTSVKTKEYEKKAALQEKLNKIKDEWNQVYTEIYFGKEVSDFAVPNMGCMDEASTIAAWGDPNKMKNVDADEVEEVVGEDGVRKKVWRGRNYATVDPVSGKSYCGTIKDPNVQKDVQFHDLTTLDSIKEDASWPLDDEGKAMSVADVYNRAAFCAQQNEETCTDNSSRDAPLGKKMRGSEVCRWTSNYKHGGRCMPEEAANKLQTTGKNIGDPGKDRYAQWFERFRRAEQELVQSRKGVPGGLAQRTAGAAVNRARS